jgi:maleate isomerase
MPDSLGWRRKFGVIAPSTNTAVQPEFDAMRQDGVTNHFGRIAIPNMKLAGDDDFNALMDAIRGTIMDAVDAVMSCQPDYLVMGMSAETFWDGLEGSIELEKRIEARAGVKVAMGSDACRAALRTLAPEAQRIAVITPYQPVGDRQVIRFFGDCGYEVAALKGLKCESPVAIAHVSERTLRDAIVELNGPSVDAIVQVGTNLAMARLAAVAEFWLDKPVIAINTATYWWALRQNGIMDRMRGFGALLEKH